MKKKFITFCFAGMALVAVAKNIVDEVAWIIGDEPIYKSEIEEQYMQMQFEGAEVSGDPYCVIPERMAIQKLFLHQAKIDTIVPSESMVNAEVENIISNYISNIGSREKLEEYLRKSLPDIRDDIRQNVRNNYTVQQVQSKLTENIKATPADVRKFYSTLSDDQIPYIQRQVVVKIITRNPVIPDAEIEEVKSRLRDFTKRVNAGEIEFSSLARLYSEDGSSRVGGELGFKGKSEFTPAFSAVAFNLNDPKKVSKIVETEFGFHIIQLIEKRGDRANFRHILLKPHVSDADLAKAIETLDSLKKDIVDDKISFENAAYWVSQDDDSRKNHGIMLNNSNNYDISTKFKLQELPQEVARKVAEMKVGEISEPFIMMNPKTNREIVALVKLDQDIEGHKANLAEDYQLLKNMYERDQQEKIIQEWIKKKQKETFIKIEEGWRNCEFNYDGWLKESN